MREFFLISLLLTLMLTTNAQQDSVAVKDIFNMTLEELLEQTVSGVSRYKQDVNDVPNSIIVINNNQILDRGYFDLSDLLKDVPGLDISNNAGRFGEFYSLRGIAGNDRFLVLVNGHKVNPATGTFLSIGKSFSIRHADRVEIIYGPASAVYGADAFSGIINIVFAENKGDQAKYEASAYVNYGSLNTIDAGIQNRTKLSDDLSLFLSARLIKSDGFDVAGSDPIYDIINTYTEPLKKNAEQPLSDNNIYLKLQYKTMSFNYYRQQFEEGNASGLHPNYYVYDASSKWKTSTDIVWYNYKHELSNSGTFMFDVSYKHHVQDPSTNFHKWSKPNVVGSTFQQYMTGKHNTLHGVVTYNQKVSDKLHFIVGLDNEYTESIPPYANDEVLGQSYKYEGNNAKKIDNELTITENRFSVFAQGSYSPFDRLNIVVGARLDQSTRFGTTFNPRAGFSFTPIKQTSINFNFGRAFQAPSLFYQYEQFGTPNVVMLSTIEVEKLSSGWELESQIVDSYELSVHQSIGKNFKFKVGGYYNQLNNLIERRLFAAAPAVTVYNKYFDSQTSGLRNENIGSQDIYGIDFSFNAKVSKQLIVYTYYSYTDAKSVVGDNEETGVPRISEHKAWVGVTAKDLFGYLTLSPRFKWVGDIYNANTTEFSDNLQPGHNSLDLSISVNNLSKYVRVYANLYNILDDKTPHAGLYGQSGVYTSVIPQSGFTFKAGIEILLSK